MLAKEWKEERMKKKRPMELNSNKSEQQFMEKEVWLRCLQRYSFLFGVRSEHCHSFL